MTDEHAAPAPQTADPICECGQGCVMPHQHRHVEQAATPTVEQSGPLDPWDRSSDPARRFAYWFTSAPMQRQIEFVRQWLQEHPGLVPQPARPAEDDYADIDLMDGTGRSMKVPSEPARPADTALRAYAWEIANHAHRAQAEVLDLAGTPSTWPATGGPPTGHPGPFDSCPSEVCTTRRARLAAQPMSSEQDHENE